jgi:cytochrome P450 family 4
MTATAAAAAAESSAPAILTFFYLLIPALILCFVYWKLQRRRFKILADKIPGPEEFPIIGHGWLALGSCAGKFHLRGFKNVEIIAGVLILTFIIWPL